MAQPLSAFESGSTIEKRHRRGPRPSKNSSGGFTKQSEDPIAFGDWHPSLEEAMQQAVRFRMERDAAILDRQHAFDALRDLQAASARSADGSGIGTAHHVPPSAFTAELLRKDALIEQASREFSQLVGQRERDHADSIATHMRCTSELLAAERNIRAAEVRAHESNTAVERLTRAAEIRAHESNTALAAARHDLAAANSQAEHATELLKETRAKLCDADKAFVAQRALRRAAEINLQKAEHSISTLLRELRAADRADPALRKAPPANSPSSTATPSTASGPQPPSIPSRDSGTSFFHSLALPYWNGVYLDEDIRRRLREFPLAGATEASSDDDQDQNSGLSSCSHASSTRRRFARSPNLADGASSSSAAKRRSSGPESPANGFGDERRAAAGPTKTGLRDA